MTHELKTDPAPFQDVWEERKYCEVREDDRPFMDGDTLVLREFDRETRLYSGRYMTATVTHILRGGVYGLPKNLCVMSMAVMAREQGGVSHYSMADSHRFAGERSRAWY
jgi:hypothetical protein